MAIPDVVSLISMAIEEYVPRRLRTPCGDTVAVRFARSDVRPELDDRHVVLTDATEDVVVKLDAALVAEIDELLLVVA